MVKRATLSDVAKYAGVTKATVSYILNNKQNISQETKEKVMKAIQELNYVPNLAARELSVKNSKLIGVVIPQTEPGKTIMFENPFYGEFLGSIEYEIRDQGYHIIISSTDNHEKGYFRLAQERNLDGIIAIGMYPMDFFSQMKKTNVPIVLVDSYCNDHYFHSIRIDDTYGSYLATKYVLDCGHTNIAFVCGQLKENGVMMRRLNGFKQALDEKNISFNQKNVYEGIVQYNNNVDFIKRFKSNGAKTTAIVAAADMLAIGIIKGFYDCGILVPDDISVIGFDDLQISQFIIPGLTTVRQNIQRKGKEAVSLLLKNINDTNMTKHELVLPVKLVERNSVKKIL